MNDLAKKKVQNVSDKNMLISTLQNSLYVGSKKESVEMVLAYCEAARLDVMQKPVHIVSMNTRNAVTDEYEWRDVVVPGIGLYRIQADRSGTLAGVSEPEFGPVVTQTFTDKKGNSSEFSFPEWCKVSVKKLVGNTIVEFIAKEYWIENYATDSGKSTAPNAMWRKRPRGQLAKCAEAQALRRGWPEIGQAPTAEEMEGKVIDMGDAERVETRTPSIEMPKAKDEPQAAAPIEVEVPDSEPQPENTGPKINDGQVRVVTSKLDHSGLGENVFLTQFNLQQISDLPLSQINNALKWIDENGA